MHGGKISACEINWETEQMMKIISTSYSSGYIKYLVIDLFENMAAELIYETDAQEAIGKHLQRKKIQSLNFS